MESIYNVQINNSSSNNNNNHEIIVNNNHSVYKENTSRPSLEGTEYCGEGFAVFADHYRQIHGPLAISVCTFGLLTNVFNICVLTRREMISSTNVLLAGLAVADIVVIIMYIPFTLHLYLDAFGGDYYSYGWTMFLLMYVHVTQVFHTISVWLTVLVAAFRYISIGHPALSRRWLTLAITYRALVLVFTVSPLICIPSYLAFSINKVPGSEREFVVGFSDLSETNNNLLQRIHLWLYGISIKIVPCLMLAAFIVCLVRELAVARCRRSRLLHASGREEIEITTRPETGARSARNNSQSQRTTIMLLMILVLFLITELPQGILSLLSGILGKKFYQQCYSTLGDLMDILALFNSSLNFVFYLTMSSQFRDTVKRLLHLSELHQNKREQDQIPENTRRTHL